jgi:hypothetical protein
MLNKITTNISKNYSPLYFLSALGAGGLSVTFFMYLLFMTSHEQTPIPTFNSILNAFNTGDIYTQTLIIVSIIAIIIFAIFHFLLLTANIKAYNNFKKTDGYHKLKTTNAEVQLMAPPLTFAMTVNVLFILGAVFVPNLWSVVEYLFPLAMLAFGVIGYIAIKIFLDYASRVFVNGSFEHSQNNNLSQMLAVFAFAMVGVGFSASSAMSHNQTTSLIAMVFAIFFLVVVILFAVIKLILGMYHMLEQGVDKTTSVSLWIFIPIATLVGIAIFRLDMALVHNFGATLDNSFAIVLFTTLFALQIVFGLLGYKVMKNNGYFADFIHGKEKNAGSYALICPGVALVVLSFFFLHKVLILSGVVAIFSISYFVLLAPIVYLQFKTIQTLFKLNKKMLFA